MEDDEAEANKHNFDMGESTAENAEKVPEPQSDDDLDDSSDDDGSDDDSDDESDGDNSDLIPREKIQDQTEQLENALLPSEDPQ